MPWNRIVDENFVRAIQGKIYIYVFNKNKAWDEILYKEIRLGGFTRLKNIYDELEEYEENRTEFNSIDDFVPELSKELFRE
jgi:pyrimidine operon attenuation protein/uracil phosphoribosyltransferase